MNPVIFIEMDRIQPWNPGDIHQSFDVFADAALYLQDKVRRTSYDAGAITLLPKDFRRLSDTFYAVIFLPHNHI
jgi:hypothetical protein